MHKRCKICNHVFDDNTHSFICQSCLKFREYKENYKICNKEITILPELRFHFKPTGSTLDIETQIKNSSLYGFHLMDLKTGKHVIHINLYKFTELNINTLTHTLKHEYEHFILFNLEGRDASGKWDNICKKIDDWLNLD